MKNTQKIGLVVAVVLIVAGAIGGYRYFAKEDQEALVNDGLCIQVITRARNVETGEEKDFPTPCDVPKGWEVVEPKESEMSPSVSLSPSPTVGSKTTWETYQNDRYGFKISFPAKSTVKPSLQEDPSPSRVRIQNYTSSEDKNGLNPGEYYLEIFIVDKEISCDQELESSKAVKIGSVTAYRGMGMPGGEADGQRFGLCVNRNGTHFYIQATENSPQGIIVNNILNSFRFY